MRGGAAGGRCEARGRRADGVSLADALDEGGYRSRVMHATWGHLAPEERRKYPGTILFTQGEYGDCTVIRSNFPDLPGSPWFHQHESDFCFDNKRKLESGVIYKFEGTYMMFKNGNYHFSGKVKEVAV
jgi:hypothetical protein